MAAGDQPCHQNAGGGGKLFKFIIFTNNKLNFKNKLSVDQLENNATSLPFQFLHFSPLSGEFWGN
jgi:hypothetical protein